MLYGWWFSAESVRFLTAKLAVRGRRTGGSCREAARIAPGRPHGRHKTAHQPARQQSSIVDSQSFARAMGGCSIVFRHIVRSAAPKSAA